MRSAKILDHRESSLIEAYRIDSLSFLLHGAVHRLKISSSFLTLKTAPLTLLPPPDSPSSPSPLVIRSPTKANITSSQIRSATPFLSLRKILPPPVFLGCSQSGEIGERKTLTSEMTGDEVREAGSCEGGVK